MGKFLPHIVQSEWEDTTRSNLAGEFAQVEGYIGKDYKASLLFSYEKGLIELKAPLTYFFSKKL